MRRRINTIAVFAAFLLVLLVAAVALDQLMYTAWRHYVCHREVSSYLEDFRQMPALKDSADWFVKLERVRDEFTMRWEQYTEYRSRDIAYPGFNISNGLRQTYQQKPSRKDAIVVYFFGGSTTWGYATQDDETIPSWFSREAEQKGVPLKVENYADSGWIDWQGVLDLVKLCADGKSPDWVVFYIGVNEVTFTLEAPFTLGRPIWGTDFFVHAFNQQYAENYKPLRGLGSFMRYHSGMRAILSKPVVNNSDSISINEWINKTTATMLANKRFVERLGHSYGFRTVFVFQPSIVTKKSLTPFEKRFAAWIPDKERDGVAMFRHGQAVDAKIRDIYLGVGDRFVKEPGVMDARTALDGTKDLYIDWMHVAGAGNRVVAHFLFERLEHLLR